jgi:hypothetical protein
MAVSNLATPGRAPHSGSRRDTPDPVRRLGDRPSGPRDLVADESPDHRRRTSRLVAALLVAVGILVCVNSARKSLWTDESYSLDTVGRSWAGTLRQAIRFELQPPLYFLTLHGWMSLGGGIGVARLLSAVSVLGVIAICYAIGRLLRLRWTPGLAVLAASTTGIIWAASEARNYALTLLLVTATLYCFLRLVLAPPDRPGRLTVAYAALAALSVVSFYYSGFVLLGQWIAALVVRRQRARLTIALAVAAIIVAPVFPLALAQWHRHPIEMAPAASAPVGLGYAVYTTINTILKAFLGDTRLFNLPHAASIALVALVFAVAARVVTARGRLGVDEQLLAIAAIVPVCCLSLLLTAHVIPIRSRHCLVLVPVLLTLSALALSRTGPRAVRLASATVLATTLGAALIYFERHAVNTEDWRGVAAWLEARTTADDRVLVFDPDRLLPLRYYYQGAAPAGGLPTDPELEHYSPDAYMLRDTAAVAARFAGTGAHRRVYVVEASRLLPELTPSVRLIDVALARCCRITDTRRFDGVSVIEADVR